MELYTGLVLEEITGAVYAQLTAGKCPVFCSFPFLELNRGKVETVRYFVGKDRKNRLAVAVGEKEGEWRAPFSAPFAAFVELQKCVEVEYYWDFVTLLTEFAGKEQIKTVNFFLPPDVYDGQQNAKTVNALLGNGYQIAYQELNFSLEPQSFDEETYKAHIHHNARKNLNIALRSDLELTLCESDAQKEQAYEVIRINRESKGYPLRMTKDQVMQTIRIVEHEFFLVQKEGRAIAAAVVFHVQADACQVVYWGDIPDVGGCKPINFLSFELLKFYKQKGIRLLDIGPSTENGLPNFGLCSFKESIGCRVSSKFRLITCLTELPGGGY